MLCCKYIAATTVEVILLKKPKIVIITMIVCGMVFVCCNYLFILHTQNNDNKLSNKSTININTMNTVKDESHNNKICELLVYK